MPPMMTIPNSGQSRLPPGDNSNELMWTEKIIHAKGTKEFFLKKRPYGKRNERREKKN